MSKVAKQQWRTVTGQLRANIDEATAALGHAAYWVARVPPTLVCLVTGRHRWGPWERTTGLLFSQPEHRRCRRCSGSQGRGAWPGIVVEGGTTAPKFRWAEDDLR